ncbi:hypothetical protein Vafri_3850 [Volvox africanus]|uniref:Purple acid phosphatase n=1 Tax=Volvox africanus TaxID=51714 RepID=A0A8J4ASY5_9CHLO|nr:hypothetical protein Vafri_3850 [Volvox africanus]
MADTGLGCAIHHLSMLALICLLKFAVAARMVQKPQLRGSLGPDLQATQTCLPIEVHLAVSDDRWDIRATWRTQGTGCSSSVSYGLADPTGRRLLDKPLLQSGGSSYTISEGLMCDAPASDRPFTVHMHTAVMSDLEPGALYWYSLGNRDSTWTFRAPPRADADQRLSFIAFGDMGESNVKARKIPKAAATVKAIAAEIDRRPVDLILHVGDLAYADGKFKVWDSFMAQIEPLASRIPYMIGIGNHEAGPCSSGNDLDPSGEGPYQPDWGNYGSESGGECGAMAAHRFIMPGLGNLEARRGAFAAAAAAATAQVRAPITADTGATSKAAAANAGERPPGAGASVPDSVGSGPSALFRRALVSSSAASAGFVREEVRLKAAAGAGKVELQPRKGSGSVGEEARTEDYGDDATGDQNDDENEEEEAKFDAAAVGKAAGQAAAADLSPPVSHHPPHLIYRRNSPNPPFWYSFASGPVHFSMLSSEHDLEPGSTQQSWLESDLAAVDRCRTPWVIVMLHRPMYVVYPHKDNRVVGDHIRASIEDLLLDYQVDVVVSGHVHTYYRSCSAAGGKCVLDERKGIVHLVVGTAGHELSNVEDDQKDWCDEVINDWGFGRFDVDGDVLRFSFTRTGDGRVADSLTLRAKVSRGEACDRARGAALVD